MLDVVTQSPIDTSTTIATPTLWAVTLAVVVGLLVMDFVITHRPHEVGMREALYWTAFYIALPVAFGVWVWSEHGHQIGLQYYTGYIVEKSLSVDNLFVFILILGSFSVPRALQQRVLLFGIAGALVMRGIFIAVGATLLSAFDWMFLVFGLVLVVTAVKVLRDTITGAEQVDVDDLRVVKLARKIWPVTDDYRGTHLTVREQGRRMITPLALVVIAILGTDVVFAVDSVPAVYGITGDPYLVFVTNAFALLGLRALYFVLAGALDKLSHLGYGLAVILAFIGVKLGLHWAHTVWEGVPTVPTLASLVVIVGVLTVVTVTSLVADRRREARLIEAEDDGTVKEQGEELPKS